MMMTLLPHRGVLEIQGEDKASFLQGLISNDINGVAFGKNLFMQRCSVLKGVFSMTFFYGGRRGDLSSGCGGSATA